jgi:hypothetical protein
MKLPIAVLLAALSVCVGAGRIMFQVADVSEHVRQMQADMATIKEDVIVLRSHARSWSDELRRR